MEVVLGGLTSLFYGVADFLGGEGARKAPASAVVLWSGVLSFPLILVAAVAAGGVAGFSDYLIGFAAGTAGAIGLVALFAGLGRGRAAGVAPTAAALAAAVPVAVAVIGGERPSALAWLGIGIAVPAVALCSWADGDQRGTWGRSLSYGVAAGIGLGGFIAIIQATAPESNLLPLVTSRAATMLTVVVLGSTGLWRLAGPGSMPRGIVAGNALLDVSGNIALLLAVRAGSLALAAVAASFYPAVTVLLARTVNGERLVTHQVAGLGLTVVALSVIAVG